MVWGLEELRRNASVLYNHLCSDDADRVYVDANGHLQVDERSWVLRQLSSLGDLSRDATDKAAIRTLRRILNALESGQFDPEKVIIQEKIPSGLFMMDGQGGEWGKFKEHIPNPDVPLSMTRSAPEKKWIGRDQFGTNISNASRFKTSLHGGEGEKAELVDSKVTILAGQIIFGKETYRESRKELPYFKFYDVSSDEE